MTLNTVASLAQAIVTAAALFVVYDYVVGRVGLVDFGVWAVVASAATTASIGNMGLASASLKYVARYLAMDRPEKAAQVVLTSLTAVALLVALLAGLAYLILPWVLTFVLQDPAELALAMALLPWSLGAFWILAVAGIPTASLDGFNRVDQRVLASLVGVAGYVVLVVLLVPRLGVMGLVYSQLGQGCLTALTGWILLRRVSGHLPILPLGFNRDLLREIASYGLNFQAISVTQILFEPTAKAVLTRFGGGEATGLFELANRLVVQLRSLINSSHQALLPYIAHLHESDPDKLSGVYQQSVRVMSLISLTAIPIAILAAPVASLLWLGGLNSQFLVYVVILACAWLGNLLANPAYYANAGMGTLRWNLIGHVVIAVANPALGIGLGLLWGPSGVVMGFGLALLAGSAATAIEFGHRTGLGMHRLLGTSDALLAGSATIAIVLGLALAPGVLAWGGAPGLCLFAALVLAMLVPAILAHPESSWLLATLKDSGTDRPHNRTHAQP